MSSPMPIMAEGKNSSPAIPNIETIPSFSQSNEEQHLDRRFKKQSNSGSLQDFNEENTIRREELGDDRDEKLTINEDRNEEGDTSSSPPGSDPPPPPPPTSSTQSTPITETKQANKIDHKKQEAASLEHELNEMSQATSEKVGDHDIAEKSPGNRYVRFHEKLGSGAYKDVYRAYDTIEGIEVAWNLVTLSGIPKHEKARIINEVRLLEKLNHNNIISFHGSWVNREREEVVFVTEILSSGTLKSFINKVKVVRWRILKRWCIQILRGLSYLHGQEPPVIHRDLKCDNIFINGTSGDLRIGDLGLSTVMGNRSKALSVLGTPEFMAPELYDESYDEKVDVYAFGMCLLEMITQEIPYKECTNPAQIFKKVTNNVPPKLLSRVRDKEARDFISLCLESSPEKRPSTKELLESSFLEKKDGQDDHEPVVDPPVPEAVSELPERGVSVGKGEGLAKAGKNGSENDLQKQGEEKRGEDGGEPSTIPPPLPLQKVDSSASVKSVKSNEPLTPRESGGKEISVHPPVPEEGEDGVAGQLPQDNNSGDEKGSDGGSDPRSRTSSHDMGANNAPNHRPQNSRGSGEYTEILNSMQESEMNMKKVTVMMGRKTELTEEDGAKKPRKESIGSHVNIVESSRDNKEEKDVLHLCLILPVEGKQKQVQFSFHLVEDDPLAVAKEMVTELNVSEDDVSEISITINRLALAARQKQSEQYENDTTGKSVVVVEQQQQQAVAQQQQAVAQQQQQQQQKTVAKQQQQQQQKAVPAAVGGGNMPQHPPPIISTLSSTSIAGQSGQSTSNADLSKVDDDLSDDDEIEDEEMKLLKAEYTKNLGRANKAYHTRMDNLHKSRTEREQQHQKIVEKHERDMADYEKRIFNAEAEQKKRLKELETEWDTKKKELNGRQAKENLKNVRDEVRRDAQMQEEEEKKKLEGGAGGGGGGGGDEDKGGGMALGGGGLIQNSNQAQQHIMQQQAVVQQQQHQQHQQQQLFGSDPRKPMSMNISMGQGVGAQGVGVIPQSTMVQPNVRQQQQQQQQQGNLPGGGAGVGGVGGGLNTQQQPYPDK
ncbi:hypothetical protein TrST_g8170 [Triparma strigata]|uniref:non-specific serine/threonine protein kinase n=1 Tax=Triparma strigata TaxID=1606541 RepID=A0A9W7AV42_9STRA|nr:hypothetical protein TrST_g8170 [Triparma strigata]